MRLFTSLICGLSVCLAASGLAFAQNKPTFSVVNIRADARGGVGYAVAKGSDCLIITARHVIIGANGVPASAITVTDKNALSTRDSIVMTDDVSADLVVLKSEVPKDFDCKSVWQDGAGLDPVLEEAMTNDALKFYIISLNTEGVSSEPGTLSNKTATRFTIKANVRQGNSGSPVVYSGGNIAGILLTASAKTSAKGAPGTATVLRQDYINSLIKDLVKVDGIVLAVTPVTIGGNVAGVATELATATVRRYLETQPKLILRFSDQITFGADGKPANVGDAQFVLRGNFLQLSMVEKVSTAKKAKGLGQILGSISGMSEIGNALVKGGEAADAVSDGQKTYSFVINGDFQLYDIRQSKTYSEKAVFKGDIKGAQEIAFGEALEKATANTLPKLLANAGLAAATAATVESDLMKSLGTKK
jgi:hypothetical protein